MSSPVGPETGEPKVVLYAEEASVSRRQIAGETVRISTVTRERERVFDEELASQRVEIERVPVGIFIDAMPPTREEGDTTIIPVVDEVVSVVRRLMLKEEVRIRRVRATEHHRETVMVREQDAVITRTEAGQSTLENDGRSSGPDPTSFAQEQQG